MNTTQTQFKLPEFVVSNGTITGNAWTNPDNVLFVDTNLAQSDVNQGSSSDMIIGGFNPNLPQNATILGIEMKLIAKQGATTIPATTLTIYAVDNSSGSNVYYPYTAPVSLTDDLATYVLGSSTYLFGQSSLTPDQVNNLKLEMLANGNISVDSLLINVFYSLPDVPELPDTSGEHCPDCNSPIELPEMFLQLSFLAGQTKFYLTPGSMQYANGTAVEPSDIGACGGEIDFTFDPGLTRGDSDNNFMEDAVLSLSTGSWSVLPNGVVEVDIGSLSNRGILPFTPYTHNDDYVSDHNAGAKVIVSNSGRFYSRFRRTCSEPTDVNNEIVAIDDADVTSLSKIATFTGDISGNYTNVVTDAAGHYSYLGYPGGFSIIDVSVKTAPVLVIDQTVGTSAVPTLAIDDTGNTLYVLYQDEAVSLEVWDVTVKASPSELGDCDLGDTMSAEYSSLNKPQTVVIVNGSVVTCLIHDNTNSRYEIRSVDVSTPASPTQIANPITLDDSDFNSQPLIWVSTINVLLVATASDTNNLVLRKYSMTSPSAPALLGSSSPIAAVLALEGLTSSTDQNEAFVVFHSASGNTHDLASFAINTGTPVLGQDFTTAINTGFIVEQISYSNNGVSVATETEGVATLYLFDVTDPTDISQTASAAGSGAAVFSQFPYIYVAANVDDATAFIFEIITAPGTHWTLAHTPIENTEHIYARQPDEVGGTRLYPEVDYTIAGAEITTNDEYDEGDILADYQY